jgi:hypothetical protein
MTDPHDRKEFYKARGITLAVTTCPCCCFAGYHDAWRYTGKGSYEATAYRQSHLDKHFTLITQREAIKRVGLQVLRW